MGIAHSEILSSYSRSGSPRRATGGVCRRPHNYPHPQDGFESFFSDSNNQPSSRTLVTARGGKVAGAGGLLLDIPAGALLGPAVIKITQVFESALPHPVPASGKFIGAVNIDSGGVNFLKEVKVSLPLPANLPAGAFVYVTQPKVHVNPDASEEQVYVVIDSTRIVDGRLSCASPPFDGIMGFGLYAFVMFNFDTVGVAYGTTYRDMDGDNIYTPGTDQPIRGAVIRCATAENFISYSGVNGNYAATLVGPAATCNTSVLTATHPLTMQRVSRAASSCQSGTSKLDLKLADKGTVIPDATAPTVTLGLKVVPGQSGDPRLLAGTVLVGTELEVAISAIDQEMESATLVVDFQRPEMPAPQPTSVALAQASPVLQTARTTERPAIFRYDYTPDFATLAGSVATRFKPTAVGTYTLIVEATDKSNHTTVRRLQLRTVSAGDQPIAIDGPPQVDELLPAPGAREVMVTTPIIITFSEVVENLTTTPAPPAIAATPPTLTLTDQEGRAVPALVYTSIEGGRMRATLVPRSNLAFATTYRVTISTAITDSVANPSYNNVKLPLTQEVTADFTTKTPRTFVPDEQFSGGRDIDLYTPNDESGRTYAYVTAGWSGWRVIDITDPTRPTIVHSVAAPPNWSYRGIAVEPQTGTLGMTINVTNSASQYAYIEFRDLAADPVKPPYSGRDLLASAYSGIPGRLDLDGNYAYIATVIAGLQVVDIGQATADLAAPSRGQSIVGGFDSGGQGYGEPSDAQVYGPGKLLVTTSKGYLLLLSVASPAMPMLSSAFRPDGYQATRAAAVSGYQYNDADGNPQVIDLAVTSGLGQLYTVNLSDPANPEILGRALDENGAPAIVSANDITINKEAGLVFVTTYSSVQVFDIKDPLHPKRLANLTQLPDENGTMLPLGSLPALVEKDGWVYLGSETGGMRAMEFNAQTLAITPRKILLSSGPIGPAMADIPLAVNVKTAAAMRAETVFLRVYENGVKIWETDLKGIREGSGSLVSQGTFLFPAKSGNFVFDATKRYEAGFRIVTSEGGIFEETKYRVTLPTSWAALTPDYNHNREIDTEDKERAAKGDIYYYWINDDDDEGETQGDDIPLPMASNGESRRDADNNRVDGVRDLIDFFPVALDVKALVGVFPPNVYTYRLKSAAEKLKVVFPELTTATVKNYLIDVETARAVALKPAFPVPQEAWPSDGAYNIEARRSLDALLASAATQDAPPVILLEGVKPGTAPLVLEIVDATGKQVFASSLNLSLDGVEQMFRQKNLIAELSQHSEYYLVGHDPVPSDKGMPDRIVKADFANQGHFAGFDADSDQNNFVHVHGYNVNDQAARGEQAEAFKRLYWSGSKAKFWGMTWYGWESQSQLLERSPNYHVNVRHAFNSGRLLKNFVIDNQLSNATIFAHSLGNMVVSSAIEEGMTVAHYLMVNAAVAEESYTPQETYDGQEAYESGTPWRTATKESMYHPAWRYPDVVEINFEQGYQPPLWASEWYKIFDSNDGRSTLTWRNRFEKVRNLTDTYVYYAPTDEVFRAFLYTVEMAANDPKGTGYQPNTADWPGWEEIAKNALSRSNTLGAYGWSLQELLKGRMFSLPGLLGDKDSDTGGWGFNLQDGYQFFDVHVRPAVANSYPSAQLKAKPFFLKNSDFSFLYTNQPAPVSAPLREELLANELPALTFAAGHRGVKTILEIDEDRDINIRNKYAVNKPWLADRPRFEWRHSDIYVVAYPYLSGLYDEWVKKFQGATP